MKSSSGSNNDMLQIRKVFIKCILPKILPNMSKNFPNIYIN